MEDVIRVAAVCAVCTLLAVLLKKNAPEYALALAAAVCAAALAALAGPVREVLALIGEMLTWTGLPEEIFLPLMKTVGIAVVCRLGTELCRDGGQSAMAAVVEMAGALGAILVALPLFRSVWEMLQSLL